MTEFVVEGTDGTVWERTASSFWTSPGGFAADTGVGATALS